MSQKKSSHKKSKKGIIGITILSIIIGGIILWHFLSKGAENIFNEPFDIDRTEPIYSRLTGLEIASEELNSSPTFCIQIPNGSTDGARPQAGLGDAAIVFEAIAETGITRFAAIFQNPTVSVIGPIRSLRPYYLSWDTPFDCTVVHAGGSDEALKAIASGGQRNLDENYSYMWRESSNQRRWNNLFTSSSDLMSFNLLHGYNTSSPKVFSRLTPSEASSIIANRQLCTNSDNIDNPEQLTSCANIETASTITINFSSSSSHNVLYSYDAATNTYLRSHQDGQPHLTYECAADLLQPDTIAGDCGDPVQVAPNVVVAMHVQESTMTDNYHQDITTIGSGKATIFQNGLVISGTWSKTSDSSQIIFKDLAGQEISFTPGQLWIAAVPQFGNVSWK